MPKSPASTLRRNPSAAWRHLDLVLVGCVAEIACLGALMVYSATRGPTAPYSMTFFEKQALYVGIGFVVLAVATLVDYRVFRLRGEPLHDVVHRIYVGGNIAF